MEEVLSYAAEQLAETEKQIKKPPLGAMPYNIVLTDRINNLLDAIKRYVNERPLSKENIARTKLWAVELDGQIDLLGTMLIYDT